MLLSLSHNTPQHTPPNSAAPFEYVADGLYSQVLFCGSGVAFKTTQMTKNTLVTWSRLIEDAANAMPTSYPLFMINDFSSPSCHAIPTVLVNGGQRLSSHKRLYAATVITPNTQMAMLAEVWLLTQTHRQRNFMGELLPTYAAAVTWLYEQVVNWHCIRAEGGNGLQAG